MTPLCVTRHNVFTTDLTHILCVKSIVNALCRVTYTEVLSHLCATQRNAFTIDLTHTQHIHNRLDPLMIWHTDTTHLTQRIHNRLDPLLISHTYTTDLPHTPHIRNRLDDPLKCDMTPIDVTRHNALTIDLTHLWLEILTQYTCHTLARRKYGVATVKRIDKIIGLFCRISSLL